jgi:hypothetical protein
MSAPIFSARNASDCDSDTSSSNSIASASDPTACDSDLDSDSDSDSYAGIIVTPTKETCRSTCRGCKLGFGLISYYRTQQNDGLYYYALNNDYGGFSLSEYNVHILKCEIFDHLMYRDELSPTVRSDPAMLAYVQMYSPKNIKNVKAEAPRFMSFTEYDGIESVDHAIVDKNIELEKKQNQLVQKYNISSENSTILSDAKKLASVLVANTMGTDLSITVQQLLDLLNKMVIS